MGSQSYPDTRTSTAVEGRVRYYLPYRAAAALSYRYYRDTWGIVGRTIEIDYTQPFSNVWILEGRVRLYSQGHAVFYSDVFPYAGYQNFEARDQDLAAQKNTTYAFLPEGWKVFKRGTATIDVSRVQFKYSDFRDIRDYGQPQYPAGEEPLYHFDATIYQLYMSMFF